MNKKYKKFTLIFSIVLLIGLAIYGLVNQKIYQYNNKKTDTTKANINTENDINTKNVENVKIEKKREFKNMPLKYNDKSIPVLMYHSIDYEKGNELRVPKEKFREQMKYLKDNGYITLTFDELYNFLINNKPVPEKSVVITFDDGYEDNYKNAYPILKELEFNASIFIITSTIDTDMNYLTSEQLKEMDKNGIDIESHTVNHDQLDKLSYEKQLVTLKQSKDYIEKVLNKKVNYIGYPFGKWNNDTIKAAKDAGYTMAFTTVGGWSKKDQEIYTLDRVYISADFGINEFVRRITNSNYNKGNLKSQKH